MRLVLALVVLVCAGLPCPLAAIADAGSAGSADTPLDVDDTAAWLTAHGAKDPPKDVHNPCCCVERSVGSSAEHALHCRDAKDVADGESASIAIRDVIWVVRGGKAGTVLDVWTELENMDDRPGSPPVIALRLTFDGSGKTITAVDRGDSRNSCDSRPKRSAKETAAERIYRKWIGRICANGGTYRWRGGRFQR